jgi:hypothetical protein
MCLYVANLVLSNDFRWQNVLFPSAVPIWQLLECLLTEINLQGENKTEGRNGVIMDEGTNFNISS